MSLVFTRILASQDVNVAEWLFLRLLDGGVAMAPSRVAETMGLTRSGVTRLADRLIERQFVVRNSIEGDRRFQMLSLTDGGAVVVAELARLADENDRICFEGLSRTDREVLERLLRVAALRHDGPATALQ